MKPTEKKTTSDANSTIMRPTPKQPAVSAAETKHTEKAIEKATAPVAAPATPATPKAPAKTEAKAAPAKTDAPAKPAAKKAAAAEVIGASMNKPSKKKGKKSTWVKKAKVKKDAKTKTQQTVIGEKWKPNFWGRFGKKNLRTQRDPKYAKWRKPRGIDILRERNDGELPNSGFQTPRAIRFLHPSGYQEVFVQSKKDLDGLTPKQAARFSRTIGRKKRIELIQYANSKNIQVLN